MSEEQRAPFQIPRRGEPPIGSCRAVGRTVARPARAAPSRMAPMMDGPAWTRDLRAPDGIPVDREGLSRVRAAADGSATAGRRPPRVSSGWRSS